MLACKDRCEEAAKDTIQVMAFSVEQTKFYQARHRKMVRQFSCYGVFLCLFVMGVVFTVLQGLTGHSIALGISSFIAFMLGTSPQKRQK